MFNPFPQFKIQDILDRDPDKFEPHPHRAWAGIFSMAAILISIVLVSHLYLYAYMRTDSSFKPDDNSLGVNEVKLNRKGLEGVTAMFEAKNTQFQDLLVSSPKIADPSGGAWVSAPSTILAPISSGAVPTKIIPKNTKGAAPVSVE